MYHSKEGCSSCGKSKSKTRFQTVRPTYIEGVLLQLLQDQKTKEHQTNRKLVALTQNLKICGACRALFEREQNNLSVSYLSLYICIWWFHN